MCVWVNTCTGFSDKLMNLTLMFFIPAYLCMSQELFYNCTNLMKEYNNQQFVILQDGRREIAAMMLMSPNL